MQDTVTYADAVKLLRGANIPNAPFEARLIISSICDVSFASILSDPDKKYESTVLLDALRRRAARYPLQYILGEVGFRDCIFKVTEHTLIPRPDTELLVEYAVAHIPQNAHIADLCTGSGCIAVSTLSERPDLCAVATDIDPDTLEVAAHNAQKNGVADRLTLLLDDVKHPDRISEYVPFDAILSNPPYIPTRDVMGLEEELKYEPHIALDGGEDGLDFYRAIITHYVPLLKENGFLAFEIGYDQESEMLLLAEENSLKCKIIRDYGANPRVAILKR